MIKKERPTSIFENPADLQRIVSAAKTYGDPLLNAYVEIAAAVLPLHLRGLVRLPRYIKAITDAGIFAQVETTGSGPFTQTSIRFCYGTGGRYVYEESNHLYGITDGQSIIPKLEATVKGELEWLEKESNPLYQLQYYGQQLHWDLQGAEARVREGRYPEAVANAKLLAIAAYRKAMEDALETFP